MSLAGSPDADDTIYDRARFQRLAATIPGMIYQYVMRSDGSDCFTYVSAQCLEIYELEVETMLRDVASVWAMIHPDDLEKVDQANQLSSQSLDVFDVEFRIIPASGRIKWVHAKSTPDRQPNGDIIYDGLVMDITDRKRAEADLYESELRFRSFAANSSDVIWITNVEKYQLVYVNPAYERVWGRSAADIYANLNCFLDYVHPEDYERVQTAWTKTFQEMFNLEYRILRPDGSVVWISDRGFPVYDQQHQLRYIGGIAEDVTERKRVEEDLRQKNAILEIINESIPTPIFMKDRQGRITYANPATLEVLGKSAEEVLGLSDREIYESVELGDIVSNNDQRIMESGQAQRVEESPDGIRTFLGIKAPYRNEAGEVMGLIGVANDITDRIQIERDRERVLQQEQTAREAAERANRIKDEFLAVLSHELRSPLNPILGWSKLLQTRKFSEAKMNEVFAMIERNAQAQADLIEDLLDISRIMGGKLTLNSAPVDLATVIVDGIETIRLAADAKEIDLTADLAPNLQQINGDRSRLQQVVWNLLSNAVKFTPRGGQVEVKLKAVGQQAQLQVSDNGKGINPAFLPYIFDHFRQEDGATTRKFGGLGLGLAIARQIVEMHGGHISAESSGEGQGATFCVELPFLNRALANDIATEPGADPLKKLPLKALQILVVDDEPDSRHLVEYVLEQSGARVVSVGSAQAALDALSDRQIDLILSDIGMPDLDGYQFIQQVRSSTSEHIQAIPAIAITAYAGESDYEQAISIGFQDHLAKPIDTDILITKILSHMQRST
jgi:PAS domain S-box-containing protein